MMDSQYRAVFFLGLSFLTLPATGSEEPLPWRQAGLSERQAVVYLLDRLTYGPRPGDVDEVLRLGLRNWVEWQLQGNAPGPDVSSRLARWTSLSMAAEEINRAFPRRTAIVEEALRRGVARREDFYGERGEGRKHRAIAAIDAFAEQRGYAPAGRLIAELRAQKLYRALFSESQLVEVLTELWFNHFNVSSQCVHCQPFLPAYERDAIRPFVLGSFRDLLGAVAQHPAMLLYLGNGSSRAAPDTPTTFEAAMDDLGEFSPSENPTSRQELAKALKWRPPGMTDSTRERYRGLNENYARELLELHTLGVDGGYDQRDVIEVARAFTGWTLFPQQAAGAATRRVLEKAVEEVDFGFVADGEFLFRADWHDAGAKSVLGVPLPEGRGIADGLEVLDLLVQHRSTARRVAWRLAVRFVADQPPTRLIDRLARKYELSRGDLREVVRELVEAPEFWREGDRRSKLKTPLELVVSALRALDAEVAEPWALNHWISLAGQRLYEYAAPTGYPDRPSTWSSTGSLLARLNFGLALGRGKIEGVSFDPLATIGVLEPASVEEALRALIPLMLPERPIDEALAEIAGLGEPNTATTDGEADERRQTSVIHPDARRRSEEHCRIALGLLIASPEFQHR